MEKRAVRERPRFSAAAVRVAAKRTQEKERPIGITDKITGRVKQAAGDLLGDEGIRREGVDEERKGDAKEELARDEERADRAEARADEHAAHADARAQAAAQREYQKADAQIEREERQADAQRAAADERG